MAIQSQKKAAKVATDHHDAKPTTNKQGQQQSQSLLSKALTAEFDWSDKDEFLDVIYWMRQIMGLLLGLVWGIIPLKGLLGLALFMLVNVAIAYIYYNSFQKVDEETYGGTMEILKEGFMTSVSSFLACGPVNLILTSMSIGFDFHGLWLSLVYLQDSRWPGSFYILRYIRNHHRSYSMCSGS